MATVVDYLKYANLQMAAEGTKGARISHLTKYRWSSYQANALCEPYPLVTPQALYPSLGRTAPDRANAYRELLQHDLDSGLIDEIRSATNGNFALGGGRFAAEPRKLEERERLPLPRLGA